MDGGACRYPHVLVGPDLFRAAGVAAAGGLDQRDVVSGKQRLGHEVGAVATVRGLIARLAAPVGPGRASGVRRGAVVVRRVPPRARVFEGS